MLQKVLIAAPTSILKEYCFEDWLENIMNFKYPNFQIRLFDNTPDNGDFTKKCNKIAKSKYGSDNRFEQIFSNVPKNKSIIEKIAISHEQSREFAIANNFDFLFHLESDVFPPANVIENLMAHNKGVVGGIYYTDEGINRRVMVQRRIYKSPHNILSDNLTSKDDLELIDGSLKIVASVGLGCVLIKRKVLKKIKFRSDKNQNVFPDSLFSEDLFKIGIPVFIDTSVLCDHKNQAWEFLNF